MRDDDPAVGAPEVGAVVGGNLSFAAFTLAHAACGDGLIELRLGDRLLLEWCPACAVMATFLSPEGDPDPDDGSTV